EDPPGRARQANGFELVRAHLEMARREPEYKFVLAEVDYLKPYWDTHPHDRTLRRPIVAIKERLRPSSGPTERRRMCNEGGNRAGFPPSLHIRRRLPSK
ncbi:hypothetical protein, partial [Mycobacterium tuberculosis]|uniref:hypothetical protein n=1 Tax=Mycobacterium tuberculosis TaxID=1773 RepID=UPI000B2A60A8